MLNTVDASTHRVIVAGENFGCGSSREHAPWAIYDFGVRVVVSSRIADIFRSNAQKNGVLPVVVDAATHAQLLEQPGREITVDLEACELRFGNHVASFEVDPFARACLMEGVDSLGYLLKRTDARGSLRDPHRRMKSHSIVLLPGDGVGPEVTAAARDALQAVGERFGLDLRLRRPRHRRRRHRRPRRPPAA